ncbi:MAG: hypothetical protein IJS09_07570 [Treponema sp.]|nr:hypothetical protein [Treponema sp.]
MSQFYFALVILIDVEASILLAFAIFDRLMSCLASFMEFLEAPRKSKERRHTLEDVARVFIDATRTQNGAQSPDTQPGRE